MIPEIDTLEYLVYNNMIINRKTVKIKAKIKAKIQLEKPRNKKRLREVYFRFMTLGGTKVTKSCLHRVFGGSLRFFPLELCHHWFQEVRNDIIWGRKS